jgi:guanylate kinase
VISGPSGAGKGTVIARVLEALDGLALSVSATTRVPRPGEIDGVHYHFMSRDEFERAVMAGRFLEWVEYGSDLYGTLRGEVDEKLKRGCDVILEIELQGARAVRRALPEAELIFIAPPSFTELVTRLRGRATESEDAIATRLRIAREEVAAAKEFDHVVINDEADTAAREVTQLILARRLGVS